MSLTNRALLPIFILTITVIGFNEKAEKAHSQSKIPLLSDSPQRLEIEERRLVIESIQVGAFKQGSNLQPTIGNLQSLYLSQLPDAETLLLQALEVANSLKDPYDRARLLNDIAIQYAKQGKPDRAQEILDQSLAVARTIEDARNKVITMGAIALHYAEIGQLTSANALLSETSEIANSVEDKSLQASLLSDLALKYAELGEQSPTETLLSQSQEILEQASVPVAEFPFQPTPIEGRFALGANVSSTQITETDWSAQLKLAQQWETDDFSLDIDYETDFDSSRTENEYRTTINTFGKYRHHFDETWSLFTLVGFERNIEDGVFYDLTPLVGPSLNIFRQGSERSLDLGVGLGLRHEDSLGKPIETSFPTVGLVVIYKDRFFEFLKFSQRLLTAVPVKDSANWRLSSTAELSVPLWEQWFFTTQVRYIYRGEPAIRRPGSDFKFTTGISYEF